VSLVTVLPPLEIYRDDLNHPTVSGNKLHKLKPNIELAKKLECRTLLSFGGAYSNHLHALAWASMEAGLASIGLVRGELHAELTPTLADCRTWGMRLLPTPRKTYRELQDTLAAGNMTYLAQDLLPQLFSNIPKNTLVIAEGGSNALAIKSLTNAYQEIFEQARYENITHAVCATGTGATVAGLSKAVPNGVKVIGVQAVAEGDATGARIHSWLGHTPNNLEIMPGHLGGFAKTPNELLRFIQEFESTRGIPLDPIYNGKVLYKLANLAKEGYFSPKDKVLVIHTGGLQGKRKLTED
jgi:1-aminocyclopropane-1-carboxylate deaminase